MSSLDEALEEAQPTGSNGRKEVQHESGARVSVYSDMNHCIVHIPGQILQHGTMLYVTFFLKMKKVSQETGWSPVEEGGK
jgi:hypothetical protein